MVKEQLNEKKFEDEEEKDDEEDEEEDEDVEKSVSSVLNQLQNIVDSQSVLIDTQKAIGESIIELAGRVDQIEKADNFKVNPKTDLPATHGAEVKIPVVYNSESVQAKLDADGEGTTDDKVKIEKHSPSYNFTTETPRPNASFDTVNKSYSQDYSPILKDARASGDLSQVARDILAGKYYVPTQEEVGF